MVDDSGITGAVLLQHIQGMQLQMNKRFDTVDQHFDRLERKVDLLSVTSGKY